ncbi:MAG: sulfite exporter TauE/SafE family protein [Thermoanaerobaculia bacterium]|nr:sulfite exporter TauE/SafE family protein [Thermoanaerobaculia bacterium]
MTPDLAPAVATALWLGVLTSISPCPLATNIAAVSYIARRVDRPRVVLLSAFSYSLGRALAYAAVSAVVVLGLLSVPGVSQFLQRYMNKLLGPLLVLVGMYLLGLLSAGLSTTAGSEELRKKAADGGALGALLLGALFALSFCPVSAALFFGSLVPLSLQHGSKVVLPVVYGLGTALPVVLLALVATGGTKALGAAMKKVGTFEVWARRITGVVFVAVGIYLSVRFVFLG